jgi:hypothetical protein
MPISHQAYLLLGNLIWHFHWLLLVSAVIVPLLWFFNFQNRRAVLLFSLALPGALVWCAMVMVFLLFFAPPNASHSLVSLALGFPSALVLPCIAIFQLLRLRAPSTRIGAGGFALAFVIVALYAWTTVMDRVPL